MLLFKEKLQNRDFGHFLTPKNGRAFLQALFVQIEFFTKTAKNRPRGSGKPFFLKTFFSKHVRWKALDKLFSGVYGSGGWFRAVLKPQWIFGNLPSPKTTIFPKPT